MRLALPQKTLGLTGFDSEMKRFVSMQCVVVTAL